MDRPDPATAAPSSDVARLTGAIAKAADAGQWPIVELLGRQLEALTRAAAGNVLDFEAEAKRRGRR